MTKVGVFRVRKVPAIKRLCEKPELNPLTPPSLCQREGGRSTTRLVEGDEFMLALFATGKLSSTVVPFLGELVSRTRPLCLSVISFT